MPLITVVTYVGPMVEYINGILVVEKDFCNSRHGQIFRRKCYNRDYTVIMGMTLILCCLYIVNGFLVDIAYALIDLDKT